MKLLIEIPDDDYKVIIENADFYKEKHWGAAELWDAIVGGVPLPKEHGRLIDADALYRRIKTECNPYGRPTIDFESGKKVLDIIDNAPTVEPQMTELEEHFYHRCGFLQGIEEGKKLTR